MTKNKLLSVIVALFFLVAILGAVVLKKFTSIDARPIVNSTNQTNRQDTVDDKNVLFVAKYNVSNNGNLSSVFLYKPGTNHIIKSKEIDTVDVISPWDNGSVQYNNLTKDIIYSTKGSIKNGALNCMNRDGSCDFRIYKINFDEEKAIKLFEETNNYPSQWILNKTDNSLYLFYAGAVLSIKKVKIDSGIVETIINQPNAQELFFDNIQVSQDGKELFASCSNSEPGQLRDSGYLCNIDLVDKKFTSNLITTDASEVNSISPNKQYFVFSSNQVGAWNGLRVYNLKNKKTIEIPNSEAGVAGTIVWSSDSSQMFFVGNKGLTIFDINKGISDTTKLSKYSANSSLWSLSIDNNYALFYSEGKPNTFVLTNLLKEEDVIKLPDAFLSSDYHYSVMWYQE